jgi:hypothetical protein
LENRTVDPNTGQIILTAPDGYDQANAPSGGGFLLVGPDWTPGDNRNVIRVQPYGTAITVTVLFNTGAIRDGRR